MGDTDDSSVVQCLDYPSQLVFSVCLQYFLPNKVTLVSLDDLYYALLLISEKKRYRESYISDDLDLDPPGSESSPGLSRHSTSSSGIEADARQHSISTEMASMEEEGQRRAEKCFSSAASRGSSCTSGFDAGSKARMEDEGWQEEGEKIFMLKLLYDWTF